MRPSYVTNTFTASTQPADVMVRYRSQLLGPMWDAGLPRNIYEFTQINEWKSGYPRLQENHDAPPGCKTQWRLLIDSLPMLHGYVYRLIGNGERAREVLQEVSLRMLATEGPDDPERYAAWARGVARHVIAHDWRMRRRALAEQPLEDELMDEISDARVDPRGAPGRARLDRAHRRRHRQRRAGAAVPPLRLAGDRQGAGRRDGAEPGGDPHAADAPAFQRVGAGAAAVVGRRGPVGSRRAAAGDLARLDADVADRADQQSCTLQPETWVSVSRQSVELQTHWP